jgi:hypothetical protein
MYQHRCCLIHTSIQKFFSAGERTQDVLVVISHHSFAEPQRLHNSNLKLHNHISKIHEFPRSNYLKMCCYFFGKYFLFVCWIGPTIVSKNARVYDAGGNLALLIGMGEAQGCQMVYCQTKIPDLGTFWRALEWKMLLYFMIMWNILWPYVWYNLWQFGIICCHLVYFFPFWYVWTKENLATLVRRRALISQTIFSQIYCFSWSERFLHTPPNMYARAVHWKPRRLEI